MHTAVCTVEAFRFASLSTVNSRIVRNRDTPASVWATPLLLMKPSPPTPQHDVYMMVMRQNNVLNRTGGDALQQTLPPPQPLNGSGSGPGTQLTDRGCGVLFRYEAKEGLAINDHNRRVQANGLSELRKELSLVRQQVDIEGAVHATTAEFMKKLSGRLQSESVVWSQRREDDLLNRERDLEVWDDHTVKNHVPSCDVFAVPRH